MTSFASRRRSQMGLTRSSTLNFLSGKQKRSSGTRTAKGKRIKEREKAETTRSHRSRMHEAATLVEGRSSLSRLTIGPLHTGKAASPVARAGAVMIGAAEA